MCRDRGWRAGLCHRRLVACVARRRGVKSGWRVVALAGLHCTRRSLCCVTAPRFNSTVYATPQSPQRPAPGPASRSGGRLFTMTRPIPLRKKKNYLCQKSFAKFVPSFHPPRQRRGRAGRHDARAVETAEWTGLLRFSRRIRAISSIGTGQGPMGDQQRCA